MLVKPWPGEASIQQVEYRFELGAVVRAEFPCNRLLNSKIRYPLRNPSPSAVPLALHIVNQPGQISPFLQISRVQSFLARTDVESLRMVLRIPANHYTRVII